MTTAPRTLERGRIGESVKRADAIPKVTGEFAYSSDLFAAGMLWGHTLRSPHAHARIAEIDISAAVGMPGVHAVLTHADVPGAKTYGLEFPDQPVLAIDRVRYFGEPVALVAAEHPEQARRAAARIVVEYEPLPAVVDVERDQVAPCLDLPPERVRLHLAGVGGAFGGREDLSMQIHGALLALHTNRPLKIVYNRQEMLTRHAHRH